jgi:GGDEF domain-containing protein
VPWRNRAERITGVAGIEVDITAQKKAEQQLHRMNEKLLTQVGQLRQLQNQLREQAIRDPLTQLYNRRYLNETFPREIARALRQNQTLGVFMIDLDHFKHINDTFGHVGGDAVLESVARLAQVLRNQSHFQ